MRLSGFLTGFRHHLSPPSFFQSILLSFHLEWNNNCEGVCEMRHAYSNSMFVFISLSCSNKLCLLPLSLTIPTFFFSVLHLFTCLWDPSHILLFSCLSVCLLVHMSDFAPIVVFPRMAQQYYEYKNYKEDHVQEQKKPPKGAFLRYIVIFQSVFYIIFHVSSHLVTIASDITVELHSNLKI